jgi:hypothetical protein
MNRARIYKDATECVNLPSSAQSQENKFGRHVLGRGRGISVAPSLGTELARNNAVTVCRPPQDERNPPEGHKFPWAAITFLARDEEKAMPGTANRPAHHIIGSRGKL